MEGDNVANCSDSSTENKTECISIDDVSASSEAEDEEEKCVEKAPLIVTLEPNKKLSKICENNEIEVESIKEQEIKIDDEDSKKVLKSITPDELERLRKIFGPTFTFDIDIEKPESALDFMPSHIRGPDDNDLLKQKFKNIQKAEEHRIKLQEAEFAKKTAREEKEKSMKHCLEDDPEEEKNKMEEDIEAGFDPKELIFEVDGWEFYKKAKVSHQLVKRYCQTLD
jgi:hypothetical protein